MIAVVLLVACASEEERAAAVTPREGHWAPSGATVRENPCGLTDKGIALPAGWTLSLGEPDTGEAGQPFELVEDGSGDAMACTLDTPAFSCALERSDSGSAGGESYTVTETWTLAGTFTSDAAAEATMVTVLDCRDTNDAFCADIEERNEVTFPCTLTTDLALVRQDG